MKLLPENHQRETRNALILQATRMTSNQRVPGSSPGAPTISGMDITNAVTTRQGLRDNRKSFKRCSPGSESVSTLPG